MQEEVAVFKIQNPWERIDGSQGENAVAVITLWIGKGRMVFIVLWTMEIAIM